MAKNYQAPLEDFNFLINEVLCIENLLDFDSFSNLNIDLIQQILTEAAKFAENKLAPLNKIGDKEHAKLENGKVTTPKGFKEAYKEFIDNGWNSVPFNPNYGGQNIPWLVSTAISEMFNGSNMSFGLCPLLTQGAIELLEYFGSKEQKDKYLENLITGKYTGTMCMTEADAGSETGLVKTKAKKKDDHYLIKGQKIYITYGDHDFTDNIIHMVLARTENAPEGTRGISLFIVPKILDYNIPNDIEIIGIEDKMGINASPTATIEFGNKDTCIGYLVGEENKGMKYMFTMMNNARLSVGSQGVGISENSLQQALNYAKERVQGKPIHDKNAKSIHIINHPDVKRMILNIKANTQAMRGLALFIAKSLDISKNSKDSEIKEKNQILVSILTPVLKAHASNIGFESSSLAMQIFGGIGYIEEENIAQNLRDSRIAMIYEGTNGIQALDLVMRKLGANNGAYLQVFIDEMEEFCTNIDHVEIEFLNDIIKELYKSISRLKHSSQHILSLVKNSPEKAEFVATPYLELLGIVSGAYIFSLITKTSLNGIKNNPEKSIYYSSQLEIANFYIANILPKTIALEEIITHEHEFDEGE